MYKSIKIISAAGVFAAVLGASAFAQTEWKPPAEIAPKAAAEAGAAAAPADANAPAAATPADKKSGDEQAKPAKGKAKKHHKS